MDERRRIRLTKCSTKAGWASKFAPGDLEQASEGLTPESLEGYVNGMEPRDGAGYVPFGGGLLLRSGDFFPPLLRRNGIHAAVVKGAGVRVTA